MTSSMPNSPDSRCAPHRHRTCVRYPARRDVERVFDQEATTLAALSMLTNRKFQNKID